MKNTKDAIIRESLRLFNERGIDVVTTRDIAKTINISLGNLTYYFPTKNDIIYALFQELCKEVDEALSILANKPAKNTLIYYYNQVELVFTTQLKYKFIVHKRYGEIISSFPDVQSYVQEFLKVRFDSWEELHNQLVNEELAKEELIKHTHAISHMLNILALYWHQEFLIYYPALSDKEKIQKALSICFQTYIPYLTPKGLDELSPLLETLERY